ncbi:UDP-glucose 4-epimerase GalE [Sporolactobacillus pectinivorans]|uniref:UDP-glucose 4-epimerase GalE n=1 Tax=Sporolactobacillus pectinivorans TaxID=1591408 RepID=UPI000C256E53|nr:UDP-glucose 4-epimerase GalE [Sporolactobacillus pectinivorans]
MTILVAGGAGYIGSHMVSRLIEKGRDVAVIDNLSTGHRAAVNDQASFYEGDTRDKQFLIDVFKKEKVDAVIHMDAFSVIPESMKHPLKYFDNNVGGMITLLEVMQEQGVKKMVFSSTAATYGVSKQIPIEEADPQKPINPYGESKLMMEKIVHWADVAYGIKFVALRYFNVAGSKADGSIGEDHQPETHLIPIILQTSLGQRKVFDICGNDYDTPDGTNVRDYVHVVDLADAHILALDYLEKGNPSQAFNLGSSAGFSVSEMVEAARKVTGKPIPVRIAPRRGGDPDALVANSDKARKILGWKPRYGNMNDMIGTAWTWAQKHPNGYGDKK